MRRATLGESLETYVAVAVACDFGCADASAQLADNCAFGFRELAGPSHDLMLPVAHLDVWVISTPKAPMKLRPEHVPAGAPQD